MGVASIQTRKYRLDRCRYITGPYPASVSVRTMAACLASAAVVLTGCASEHPHVEFSGIPVGTAEPRVPCMDLSGAAASAAGDGPNGPEFSLEMAEGASAQEVAAVRACLEASMRVRDLQQKRVTYEVSRIERRSG